MPQSRAALFGHSAQAKALTGPGVADRFPRMGVRPWTPAVFVVVAGFASGAEDRPSAALLELYRSKCQQCHLADGNSPLEALNFADGKWTHGSSPAEVARVIAEGVQGSPMLPFKTKLTKEQIEELAAYVRSFDKKLRPPKVKK